MLKGQAPAAPGANARAKGATDVPDSSELIDEGIAAEKLGMLDRAESCYSLAAASEQAGVRARALTKLAGVHRSRAEWDIALEMARRAQDAARATGSHWLAGPRTECL